MFDNIKEQFIKYYQDLLIIQYFDKPKARSTIGLWSEQFVANALIWQLERSFNISDAVGEQLTILGKYVGVDRIQTGNFIEKEYFSMWFDDGDTGLENIAGFDFENLRQNAFFLSDKSFNNDIYRLTDDELRFLIQLQIINNTLDGTFANLKNSLYNFFGDALFIVDNLDMSITYWTEKSIQDLFLLAIRQNFLPMPLAQGVNVFSVNNVNDLFAFARYSQDDDTIKKISGFNFDEDPLLSGGEFFSYGDIIS